MILRNLSLLLVKLHLILPNRFVFEPDQNCPTLWLFLFYADVIVWELRWLNTITSEKCFGSSENAFNRIMLCFCSFNVFFRHDIKTKLLYWSNWGKEDKNLEICQTPMKIEPNAVTAEHIFTRRRRIFLRMMHATVVWGFYSITLIVENLAMFGTRVIMITYTVTSRCTTHKCKCNALL